MTFSNGLVISDSLWNLIHTRQHDSDCLRLLHRALMTVQGRTAPYCGVVGTLRRKTALRTKTMILAKRLPGNYFTYREKEGLISYMPKGRSQLANEDGSWKREGRQSMKPARWMKSMLNPRLAKRIKDDAFAVVTDIVRHEEMKFALVFAEVSAKEGYIRNNFGDVKSCMFGRNVGGFYDAFGATVLVAKNGLSDQWKGRAVIWRNVEVNIGGSVKEITFMDRVYSDSAETAMAFADYAKSEGWWRKEKNSYNPRGFILPDGTLIGEVRLVVKTEMDLTKVDNFPYLDTLLYGGDQWVSNYEESGRKFLYRDTNGLRGDNAHDRRDRVQDIHNVWMLLENGIEIEGGWYRKDSEDIVKLPDGRFIPRSRASFINYPANAGFYVPQETVIEAANWADVIAPDLGQEGGE